ncbi:uncharacterized protein LOC124441657 [Xenia sp. Carnegie-2017]|uniref:uncharacterized protein LOC124441657 n=1 Tax=Xenia sp. Carnegie-2017 TaxID=2897299 RepID=UPI001F04B21A|nr:uncharacterized protein LOC124441657 [Xenia sp. Carnegie-2017]
MPPAKPRLPNKPGMFGQGIYFATDSSKSAQDIYTKGSQTLLLCQVILGKSLTVKEADYTLNKKKLRSQNCDSVYAPRGTAVMNDEFVIFDPDQALPQYIVHYSISKDVLPPSPSIHTTESFSIKKMYPSREVNFQDPFEMANWQLSFAKLQAYGKENYFSEYPRISLGYGKGLLLCRVLPGKEFVDATGIDIPVGYNSKKVLSNQTGTAKANASGEMIIIKDSNNMLPFFVIYR